MIAPSGARLPRSTAMPCGGEIGASSVPMTRPSSISAPATASPSVSPVTVAASVCSSGASTPSSAGMPPALKKSTM